MEVTIVHAACGGIKVRTDITKLSNMIIARFEKGRCLASKSKMFIEDVHRRRSQGAGRVDGVERYEL